MSLSTSFWAFLQRSKAAWVSLPTAPLAQSFHIVIGNEAADADSCVSALLWAFVLAQKPAGRAVTILPVVSCPSADLALRREFTYLLQKNLDSAGIVRSFDELASDLIFVDHVTSELPEVEKLREAGRLSITLTDHNALGGSLASLGDSVVEIVDHHLDGGAHPVSNPAL
jgi:exopolyphosphatase